jgi:uncharacterized protein YkwD
MAKTKNVRSQELSSFFKFFLFVQLTIGLIFLFNGWFKSSFGYDSLESLAKGKKAAGESSKEPGSTTRKTFIPPKNIGILKQPWTIPQTPAASQQFINDLEKMIFEECNKERTKRSVPAVSWEEGLAGTARYHSFDMGAKQFLSHINPDNVGPHFRVAKLHRRYIGTGAENILKAGKESSDPEMMAKKIVNSWMNSTGHRENILSKDFTSLGIGSAEALDKNNVSFLYITQLFGTAAGYLQEDFPDELNKGQKEPIRVECVNPGYLAPVSGEIVSLSTRIVIPFQLTPLTSQGTSTNQMISTGDIKAPAQADAYQLVFHFPLQKDPKNVAVIAGPIFSVK